MIPSRLIDEHEAAGILNAKVSTLRAWRVRGSPIPYRKIGRSVRYDINDINSYIESRKTTHTSDLQI
jgi:predicted DNA-binding transcriptional regulator AlpA